MSALLFDFVEGDLESATDASVRRHLADCPHCDEFIAQYRGASELARRALGLQIPDEVADRLAAFLREQKAHSVSPGA